MSRVMKVICVTIFLISAVVLAGLLLRAGYVHNWTGFGQYVGPVVQPNQTFQCAKTLWDWMQLLIIPAALAVAVYWLNRSKNRNKLHIEEKRAQTDREIASDRSQEDTLKAYLDQMTVLLLENNLRKSEPDSEVRAVARAGAHVGGVTEIGWGPQRDHFAVSV